MKAQNLTICVPYEGCDKNCPYCVSKMTGYIEYNDYLFEKNLSKVKTLADNANITSVLLTGKGEPMMNVGMTGKLAHYFSDYPIELQTNGIKLLQSFNLDAPFDMLRHVDVIAFSFDRFYLFDDFKGLFHYLDNMGKVIRVTMNVTNALDNIGLSEYIKKCKDTKVRQFSFRQIVAPNGTPEESPERQWIRGNTDPHHYDDLAKEIGTTGREIRTLPFGAVIKDIDGVSVTYFDYCVQDNSSSDDIRSLIYQEDGHCYTSWGSRASILF